jgi:hypothetical protein
MSTPRFGAGLAVSIVFVLVGVTLARPAAAQGMYLKEIAKDGRIYVFNNAANAERFEKTGEMGAAITMLKAGPSGETVIGDSERALQLYFFRHGLPVVVPDPPPQPPPAPPWKISGLVFGDYYYFPQQHLPAFEDQHGMWIRRAYFTYDHTFTPAVTTRLRVEFNSNGKLQGGLITPYLKDAYVKWTFWKRQQVTVGYHPSLTFDFLDGLWGLRHVEKTPVDLYRMDSSRDTGFMLSGPLNESQSLRYAVQFGNESGTNAETDRFKGYRAVARYEKNPGLVVEGMVGYFNRANDADRTTAQIIAGWRQPRGRVAFQYTFQRREAAPGPFTDLNVYSGFGVYDVKPQKFSVFARVDRMNNPCLDCPGMDYLPIDAVAPFTLTIVGVEYFVLPSVRFSPNVEYVAYSEPAVGAKPKNDVAARLTFYWVW